MTLPILCVAVSHAHMTQNFSKSTTSRHCRHDDTKFTAPCSTHTPTHAHTQHSHLPPPSHFQWDYAVASGLPLTLADLARVLRPASDTAEAQGGGGGGGGGGGEGEGHGGEKRGVEDDGATGSRERAAGHGRATTTDERQRASESERAGESTSARAVHRRTDLIRWLWRCAILGAGNLAIVGARYRMNGNTPPGSSTVGEFAFTPATTDSQRLPTALNGSQRSFLITLFPSLFFVCLSLPSSLPPLLSPLFLVLFPFLSPFLSSPPPLSTALRFNQNRHAMQEAGWARRLSIMWLWWENAWVCLFPRTLCADFTGHSIRYVASP